MSPSHLPGAMRGGRFRTAPSLAHRASWLVFWLFALSFALAVLAPFVYGDEGFGSCSVEDEETGVVVVVGSAYTLTGSGDAWADFKLMTSSDGGETYAFFGSASEISGGTVDPGTTHLALWCGETTGSYAWELVSVPDSTAVPCAPDCDSNDVVAGLAQVSEQLHGLGAYLFVTTGVFAFLAVISAALAFVALRRG